MQATAADREWMLEAVRLAEEAESEGNLPIGAVVVLDGSIIARGANRIHVPVDARTRHAEMEALRAVPAPLWPRSREMTLYTTLEPCIMCAGAILLHQLGRLVFGASEDWGGSRVILRSLPTYFAEELSAVAWQGPAFSELCDPLMRRAADQARAHLYPPPATP